MDDLQKNINKETYSFNDYIFVLNTGCNTDSFSEVKYLDFAKLIEKIDFFYSDFNKTNYYNIFQKNLPLV